MSETNPREMKQKLTEALERMLLCQMPDTLRAGIEAQLARADATVYELISACANYAKRLVLSRPRADILWNPTVDAAQCVGCGACFAFCPHGVYAMRDGIAAVANPTACVILCSNCAPRCPAKAITFPPQKEYAELLRYD